MIAQQAVTMAMIVQLEQYNSQQLAFNILVTLFDVIYGMVLTDACRFLWWQR